MNCEPIAACSVSRAESGRLPGLSQARMEVAAPGVSNAVCMVLMGSQAVGWPVSNSWPLALRKPATVYS